MPVASIAAGASYSAAVSEASTVFTWGRGADFQLGMPELMNCSVCFLFSACLVVAGI